MDVEPALKHKQRREANAAFSRCRLPDLIPSSPTSSNSSSRSNSPPVTPSLSHPRVRFPSFARKPSNKTLSASPSNVLKSRPAKRPSIPPEPTPIASVNDAYKQPSVLKETETKNSHRVSRSHSSIMRQSLSATLSLSSRAFCSLQASSRTAPTDTSRSSDTSDLLSLGRLMPLARFNPFKRARADSTSAITENRMHRAAHPLVFGRRRRCKSAPSA